MKKPGCLVIMNALMLSLMCSLSLADQHLQTFTATSLATIETQHEGKPFVLMLWSLHCAPCFAELEMLGAELARQPGLPVVLVSTDAPDAREDVLELLVDYGLENVPTWQFADDIPEKLRFIIDPAWYGELPRSYIYNATHERSSHSGMLSLAQLMAALGTEN